MIGEKREGSNRGKTKEEATGLTSAGDKHRWVLTKDSLPELSQLHSVFIFQPQVLFDDLLLKRTEG